MAMVVRSLDEAPKMLALRPPFECAMYIAVANGQTHANDGAVGDAPEGEVANVGTEGANRRGDIATVRGNHDAITVSAVERLAETIAHTGDERMIVFAIGKAGIGNASSPGRANGIMLRPGLRRRWLAFQRADIHLAKLFQHHHRQVQRRSD